MSDSNNSETISVETLDEFMVLFTQWHSSKVKMLEHMMEIPPDAEVSVNDGPSMKLSGDLREGFIVGLSVALMELGQLPFVLEPAFTGEQNNGHLLN